MMTTQEFLTRLEATPFSDAAQTDVRALVGDAVEMTPELHAQIMARLEREIDEDLKDIPVPAKEAEALEKELATKLADVERTLDENYALLEKDVVKLADLEQRAEVLARLNANKQ
jgi:hypothetical protein